MQEQIKSPIISVVVPVYNSERFLRECLDSIINQTFRDIEIICVNDGSQDNSLQILREYEKQDNRVIVVDQENRGTGGARNAALELARGEYVRLCDSDDFFGSTNLEYMYNAIKKFNTDCCYIDHYLVNEESEVVKLVKNIKPYILPYNQVIDICELLKNNTFQWELLIKRELIKNIRFVENTENEDSQFVLEVLYNLNNTVHVEGTFSYYRILKNSSSRGKTKRVFKYPILLEAMDNLIKKYPESDTEKYKIFISRCKKEIDIIFPKCFYKRVPFDTPTIDLIKLYKSVSKYMNKRQKMKYALKIIRYYLRFIYTVEKTKDRKNIIFLGFKISLKRRKPRT